MGIVLLGLVGACGYGDAPDSMSAYGNTAKPKRTQTADAGSSAVLDTGAPPDGLDEEDASAPAAKPDTEWSGTLETTAWIGFGNESCKYRMRFESVKVKVKLSGAENIVSASVTATFVEETLNGCTATPTPRNDHSYTYVASPATATAVIAPAAETNKPRAELIVDVATQSSTKGRATLRWRRTDAVAPLDWISATEQVTLTKI